MIEDNDVIYLTNASIGYLIAQNIPDRIKCMVVTNSISVAEKLRSKQNVTTVLTGGKMSESGACYDSVAIENIKKFRFDRCFITSVNLSADFGLSVQKKEALH